MKKWASRAFKDMSIVPPGNGVSHQINLEHLARFMFMSNRATMPSTYDYKTGEKDSKSYCLVYPDSLVGTDSHTNALNGAGVLGWTVGGIEAESIMLGQSTRILMPRVIGYRLSGTPSRLCTSTDLVIAITKVNNELFFFLFFLTFTNLNNNNKNKRT